MVRALSCELCNEKKTGRLKNGFRQRSNFQNLTRKGNLCTREEQQEDTADILKLERAKPCN